jgi:ABC-type lipoprotein export system ATPase subunit
MSPLVVENVRKSFRQGDRHVMALDGVSLDVPAGRFVAIMGASGSGKSTLLHLMAGLAAADGGRVLVNGTDLGALSDHKLTLFRRRNIGLVFQSFNLIPTLTAEENVLLPLMLDGADGVAGTAKAAELLERLGLGHRLGHRPDAMSGGEQQRVAIGRALVTDPTLILADEPTPPTAPPSASCSATSRPSTARRSSWSPTRPTWRHTPRRLSSCATGRWSSTGRTRPLPFEGDAKPVLRYAEEPDLSPLDPGLRAYPTPSAFFEVSKH